MSLTGETERAAASGSLRPGGKEVEGEEEGELRLGFGGEESRSSALNAQGGSEDGAEERDADAEYEEYGSYEDGGEGGGEGEDGLTGHAPEERWRVEEEELEGAGGGAWMHGDDEEGDDGEMARQLSQAMDLLVRKAQICCLMLLDAVSCCCWCCDGSSSPLQLPSLEHDNATDRHGLQPLAVALALGQ